MLTEDQMMEEKEDSEMHKVFTAACHFGDSAKAPIVVSVRMVLVVVKLKPGYHTTCRYGAAGQYARYH